MQLESKRLIRLAEVMNLCGLSRASVYNYIKEGIFPPPAKFGKSSLWEFNEIQQWINQRIDERNSKIQ
ncbi:helix-turn-helix transcriptional regulator [Entomomonas asaccharolytica]|uniref:AlpA family phage regulatory protein n=1 Tax=Entomomonas asaccharolytica TaxID=2785331 RepID=A0A974NH01_9GAMM|nr:AlpA family phage regulatory protein [Entomomonas asaccharolytica]QQP86488.1 AlpA family phage regulatory protein [Entomomonas asaccharolytica]